MKTKQAAAANARKNCHPKVVVTVLVYQTEAGKWNWCTPESHIGIGLQTAGVYNRQTGERAQQWEAVNLW